MISMIRLMIVFIAFLEAINVTFYIIDVCGMGLYGVMSAALFMAVCVAVLYTMVIRWP